MINIQGPSFLVAVVISNVVVAFLTVHLLDIAFHFYNDNTTSTTTINHPPWRSAAPSSRLLQIQQQQYQQQQIADGCCPCPGPLIQCPLEAGQSINISSSTTTISLERSSTLCTLVQVTATGFIKPVGRSYEGHDWERVAGDFVSTVSYYCRSAGHCTVTLPSSNDNGAYYQLTTFDGLLRYTSQDVTARFLEQVTFGPTRSDITSIIQSSSTNNNNDDLHAAMVDFVHSQMHTVPATSHRALYRRHANARFGFAIPQTLVTHACQANTRYRRFAFTDKDVYQRLNVQTTNNSYVLLATAGHVRTVVMGPIQVSDDSTTLTLSDGDYPICQAPQPKLGGRLALEVDGTCFHRVLFGNNLEGNPPIHPPIPSVWEPTPVISTLDATQVVPIDLKYFFDEEVGIQELRVTKNLTDPVCDTIPELSYIPEPSFAIFADIYWIHDARYELLNNTLESPLPDGGGLIAKTAPESPILITAKPACRNAPRTFLNEDHCQLSNDPNVCDLQNGIQDNGLEFLIDLDHEMLRAVYETTGNGIGQNTRYYYAVEGLRIQDDPQAPLPCDASITSRWVAFDCANLDPDAQPQDINTSILWATAIWNSARDSDNAYMIDVTLPDGQECAPVDQEKVGFQIQGVEDICYENVHPDHLNVYDFTAYTFVHPGNSETRNPIKEFAQAGESRIVFPDWHEMNRWWFNKVTFPYIGRLGDSVNYFDLAAVLRNDDEFNTAIGFDPNLVVNGESDDQNLVSGVVCGSPDEIANDPTLGGSAGGQGAFEITTGLFATTSAADYFKQKRTVWTDVAFRGPDQLRQRVAWALAQILVISTADIDNGFDLTEIFLVYYDIFVRNAFGNYRDILKEVSYNQLMADMLTYFRSQSTAIVWEREGNVEYPDENYAREIMQLFTTGFVKLNNDGTPFLDNNGETAPVYTNQEIEEYARVWTGFDTQESRSNLELHAQNRVDPMIINVNWRDRLPKLGLNSRYIGDGYPLCADLPTQHFLSQGATYNLLGRNPLPQQQEDSPQWIAGADRISLDPQSALYNKLCKPTNGNCSFPSKVQLDEILSCFGNECEVNTLRVVEVTAGIYYEYVRPPCVHQAFYRNPATVANRRSGGGAMCADPRVEAAGTGCCSDERSWQDRYWGERVSLPSALERCAQLCSFDVRPPCDASCAQARFWTQDPCKLKAKIDGAGKVGLVHEPQGIAEALTEPITRPDTKTFFRVEWSGDITSLVSNCGSSGLCVATKDGMCLCDVTVVEEQVYLRSETLPSKEEMLSELTIGAFDPTSMTRLNLGDGIKVYMNGRSLTSDSVFEIVDSNGIPHWRKNIRSVVQLTDVLRFRNPVHFVSLEDPTLRDANYETDSALDHYFYHHNTPPFLAVRFAQRFGISNPSPRFVESIVSAFRSGSYSVDTQGSTVQFGSGEYGSLEAMVACVVLDREARSTMLDNDPAHGSLREPLIKVVSLLRSLEFQLNSDAPFIDFELLIGTKIGMMAHEIPNVFSFFLPEHKSPGHVAQAGLFAPEAMRISGSRIVNSANGLLSLIKFGLTRCYQGFGVQPRDTDGDEMSCSSLIPGDYDLSDGKLSLQPTDTAPASVVDELATLMTAGRLSSESREIVEQVYRDEADPVVALIKAQQLIAFAPEFHCMNLVQKNGATRELPTTPPASEEPYRAVVYVLLAGGMDSFNMLAPHTCSTTNDNGQTLLEQYYSTRTTIAVTEDERSRVIAATGQPCEEFVVHQDLGIVEQLYNEGDLAFFANMGVINKPVNKDNYIRETKTELFAHNTMQEEIQRMDPFNSVERTGILGRMVDSLKSLGFNAKPITIDDASVATVGVPGVQFVEPLFVSSATVTPFNVRPPGDTWNPRPFVNQLNDGNEQQSSVFGETWSKRLQQALFDNVGLLDSLTNTELSQIFEEDDYSQRMSAVAKLILSHERRGTDREVYFVNLEGWDHHDNLKDRLSDNFQQLNPALSSFTEEMKAGGMWNDVTVVVTSDFGRTLTANSGDGSDHAWGGNYFVTGGSVRGGQIHGDYPADLSTDGPLNVGRGRLIPTLSWESMLNSVAEWMGIQTGDQLDYLMPNRAQTGTKLFTAEEVFES